MVPELNIKVFGPPTVQIEGNDGVERQAEFRSSKTQALFFYLAVTRQPQTRQTLIGLFWPDVAENLALTSLRVALNNLHTLFPHHLAINRREVRFCPEQPYWLDLDELRAALLATPSSENADMTWAAAPPTLDERYGWLALYQGEFLAGIDLADVPAFHTWLEAERKQWRAAALAALAQLATALLQAGRRAEAEATVHGLLAIEPTYEAAHYDLMQLLSRRGDLAGASRQFARCRHALLGAFGVEPQAQTQLLHERIQSALAGSMRPLPEQIGRFATPFIGREAELEQIHTLLAKPGCRLITLAGLGGSGKTRLSLAAARHFVTDQHCRFLNGVCFVPLHEVRSAEQLIQAMADAVGAPLTSSDPPLDQLCRALRNREMLLILDNLEEALAASDAEESAACLTTLLAHCSLVRLLVTSRRPLELSAEWLLTIDGLPCPQEHDPNWRATPAVQLFLATAARLQPAFAPNDEEAAQVRQICRLVDGLPLAIQLAVAQLGTLSLAQIALELRAGINILSTRDRELPARQRSMRAIFDQTWQTLTRSEQGLLADLALLGSSFSAATAAVRGATPWALTGLVDHALLKVERTPQAEPHFVLPHLTAEYALGQHRHRPAQLSSTLPFVRAGA